MKVKGLFVKSERGRRGDPREVVFFLKDSGIEGDVHCDIRNPRQVLIVSEKVLRDLSLPAGIVSENLLLDFTVDNLESGTLLRFGSGVLLRVMFPCEVCGKLNKIRRGLASSLSGHRGTFARVIQGGPVEVGADIEIICREFRPWPSSIRHRLYELVRNVPCGYVVTSVAAARIIGVSSAHVRAFPKYLSSAPHDVPVHRLVLKHGYLQRQFSEIQRRQLNLEGVVVTEDGFVPNSFHWDPLPFLHEERFDQGQDDPLTKRSGLSGQTY